MRQCFWFQHVYVRLLSNVESEGEDDANWATEGMEMDGASQLRLVATKTGAENVKERIHLDLSFNRV